MRLRGFIGCFFLVIIFSFQALGEMTPAERGFLAEFIKARHDHPKAADLLEAIKNKIPPEVYSGLKDHVKDLGARSLPEIKSQDDVITFEDGGHMVPMKVVSGANQIFLINNKIVDFSQAADLNERWQMVRAVLPQFSSTHGFRFQLLPEAHADDAPSVLRAGGLTMGTVGVGVLAATNLWNPYGWSIIAVSAYVWNEGVCDDIGKQRDTCLYEKHVLDMRLKKEKKRSEALQARRSPSCKYNEAGTEEEGVFTNLKSFVHGVDEKSRMLTWCYHDKRKDELRQCTKDYSLDALYLCVYLPPSLRTYLDPWAKNLLENIPDNQVPENIK